MLVPSRRQPWGHLSALLYFPKFHHFPIVFLLHNWSRRIALGTLGGCAWQLTLAPDGRPLLVVQLGSTWLSANRVLSSPSLLSLLLQPLLLVASTSHMPFSLASPISKLSCWYVEPSLSLSVRPRSPLESVLPAIVQTHVRAPVCGYIDPRLSPRHDLFLVVGSPHALRAFFTILTLPTRTLSPAAAIPVLTCILFTLLVFTQHTLPPCSCESCARIYPFHTFLVFTQLQVLHLRISIYNFDSSHALVHFGVMVILFMTDLTFLSQLHFCACIHEFYNLSSHTFMHFGLLHFMTGLTFSLADSIPLFCLVRFLTVNTHRPICMMILWSSQFMVTHYLHLSYCFYCSVPVSLNGATEVCHTATLTLGLMVSEQSQ